MGRHGLDCCDFGYGQLADSCECGIEFRGAVKCGEFVD